MAGYENIYQRLGPPVSEEAQLLAEEKWILKTLDLIKKERNCYQIERLELESMMAKILAGSSSNVPDNPQGQDQQNATNPASTVENAPINEEKLDLVVNDIAESDYRNQAMEAEEEGEDETPSPLNSTAIDILNRNQNMSSEEDDEDDTDSIDNMYIDMNMLMNGGSAHSQ